MITPSTRATMAVHFPVNTLIIISLPRNEALALPFTNTAYSLYLFPPASYCFLLKGGDFLIVSFFILSCLLYTSLLSDPDGPTAAYANSMPFPRHKYQLKHAACLYIHLEIVRV